jgi:hypothetical protein
MDIKKIALYIFIFIVFIFIIYFIFLRPSSSFTNKNGKGNNCSHCDLDKNTCDPRIGKCIPKNLCDGKEKPDNACNYVCFQNKKWVCDTYPCVNSYLPDYIDCSIDQLKCDNSYLYCQGVTGCNGGDLYYHGINQTSCICPTGFKGPNSNCKFSDNTTCNSIGIVDDNGNCTCNQPYYGDKCQNKCGPTGMATGMYVYDYVNNECICGPSYELIGDKCTLRKCNGKGTLNGDTCSCDVGWTGPNCETSICNENQRYDNTTTSCICKDDDITTTPYTRYHKPECTIYHCNLESEYKDDGTCNCSKGSCGKYCQYTTNNSCNGNGYPYCNDKGIFTNSCVCDKGWTGTNCQCEIDRKPTTDDPCKGISTICGPTGWETHYSKCQDLYKSYQNENEWSKTCIDRLFPNTFYKQKDVSIGRLLCGEYSTINKNDKSYICTDTICLHGQGCPKNPPDCSEGKVNICDSTTNYSWNCKEQLSGDCNSASIGNVCKSGKPVTCFHCGTLNTTELVCTLDGGTPSTDCIKGLGIEKITPTNHNGIYIDENNNGIPIYPTTRKKECSNLFLTKNTANPYSIQQSIDPTILSNPIASYNSDNNTLTDLTTGNLYFYPNLESGKDARCILDQTDLMTYLNAPGSNLCNSNGTFIQNTTNGKFTLDSNKSPGYCKCNPGFAGNNCQFSRENCSTHGDPVSSSDGTSLLPCNCDTGYIGNKCQFSRENCSNKGNPVTSPDGTSLLPCNCDTGYIGNTCQFTTGSCTRELLPSYPLRGIESVRDNNLICDYSQTCGVPLDSGRYNCRLLVAIFTSDFSYQNYYYLYNTYSNPTYIDIYRERLNFTFKNTNGFNGVVFTTKPPGSDINGIWNGDNYKIRSLRIQSWNNAQIIVPVPGQITGQAQDDAARSLSYYIPIRDLGSYYSLQIESRDTSGSKAKIYVYLTMETSLGNWQ